MEENKYFLDIVINKEKLSSGGEIYVSQCPSLGVVSQGSTVDEAMKMIKEAVELYLEEMPEVYDGLDSNKEMPTFSIIEVKKKNAKVANFVR
jgi:predicted RNase H-like HicB family nuclease